MIVIDRLFRRRPHGRLDGLTADERRRIAADGVEAVRELRANEEKKT